MAWERRRCTLITQRGSSRVGSTAASIAVTLPFTNLARTFEIPFNRSGLPQFTESTLTSTNGSMKSPNSKNQQIPAGSTQRCRVMKQQAAMKKAREQARVLNLTIPTEEITVDAKKPRISPPNVSDSEFESQMRGMLEEILDKRLAPIEQQMEALESKKNMQEAKKNTSQDALKRPFYSVFQTIRKGDK